MIQINGSHLTIEEVIRVARLHETVSLSAKAKNMIRRAENWLSGIAAEDTAFYGINTGLGSFSTTRIPFAESSRLSRNLIISHAVGNGSALPGDVVRAAMLIRANALAKGYSGIRLEVIETLLSLLNKNLTPIIPSQGSLGSSGDLIPLAHLCLVFTRDEQDQDNESGQAEFQGLVMSGKKAMKKAGIARIVMGPKEGLALINGATFSAAIAALAVSDASLLLDRADICLALSLEALQGCPDAYDPRLHAVRCHEGQKAVAGHIRRLTHGSTLFTGERRVQDAYSLRCAPQVHGASRDFFQQICRSVQDEINSATDNPLLFGPGEVLSGGNFHGEPLSFAMDTLKMIMSEIGAISERRTFRLLDAGLNDGLPPMLVDNPQSAGLNSGLMMPQYAAASLVLENQTLSHPDSIHSLPVSANQEDHNANSMTAARHARQVIDNVIRILSIEAYAAVRALDLRLRLVGKARLGDGTQKAYKRIRKILPYHNEDTWWGPEINKMTEMLMSDVFSI
ncbi:MAG: histidine ammonia-lyase [Anaerolineaceae bacterium]|nr:histidine ammonia-lyase [Anaerolineaceae bacterium]